MMRSAKSWGKLVSHLSLLLLLITLAAASPTTALDLRGDSYGDFCSTLDSRTKRIDEQLLHVQSDIHRNWQQQNDRLRIIDSDKQKEADNFNSLIDARRADNLTVLRHAATSRGRQQAITSYELTQRHAVATRRAAIRQANTDFTLALRRYVSNRQATQAGQVEAVRIHVDDALQIARGQCAGGINDTVVGQNFGVSVRQGRETFISQRKADTAIVAQVQNLAATRSQVVLRANQSYTNVMAPARLELQAALE